MTNQLSVAGAATGLVFALAHTLVLAGTPEAPYPASNFSMTFDASTLDTSCDGNGRSAPGTDNWALTWAADGEQYAVWGDGAGFDYVGNPDLSRCKLGISRLAGNQQRPVCTDVWEQGNHFAVCPGGALFGGKSEGIVSLKHGTFYMWVTGRNEGDNSGTNGFRKINLMKSTDNLQNFTDAGDVEWNFAAMEWHRDCADTNVNNQHTDCDADASHPFFAPTFLQYGQDYRGNTDGYLYAYAPGRTRSRLPPDPWDVQGPGVIYLLRAPLNDLDNKAAWQFLSHFNPAEKKSAANPAWSPDFRDATPVWRDTANGVMRVSAVWNPRYNRVFIVVQTVDRHRNTQSHVPPDQDAYIGIYTTTQPWRLDQWQTVVFSPALDVNGTLLNYGTKTAFWTLSPKWGDWGNSHHTGPTTDFVLIGTMPGADEFGMIEGTLHDNSAAREAQPKR